MCCTHRIVASLLTVVALLSGQANAQVSTSDAGQWRSVVERLEPAAYISLRLQNGREQKGTVVAAGVDAFVFQPRTRIPVRPVEIHYSDVVRLERARQGMSPGNKVLAGAGAIVGGLLGIAALVAVSSS